MTKRDEDIKYLKNMNTKHTLAELYLDIRKELDDLQGAYDIAIEEINRLRKKIDDRGLY